MEKQNYSFATAISMVVGIVIGSGIFFKADNILVAVNGSVLLGLLGFFVVGAGVVFGALAISYYTFQDEQHIGLIGYARMALGDKFAFIVGWFSIACYFPAFITILAMVASIYLGVLLGIDSQLFITISSIIFLIFSFTINIKSPKAGGKMQVIFTIAKVIPLIVIGLIGTFFFSSPESIGNIAATPLTGGKPLSALIAIAFAFDGWVVAANISSELKDSRRNLPRALAWGAVGITLIYCLYFFGITQIIDPATIVELGDAHTEMAAQTILGPIGGKIIILFVIISVYGGLNGMTLAYLRIPKLLIDVDLMKNVFGDEPAKQEKNLFYFMFVVTGFYFIFQQLLDYGLILKDLEVGFDLSSLPIIINYLFYLVLFVIVNRLARKESTSTRVYYLVISLLAAITAVVVIYGSMQINGIIYIVFSALVFLVGIPFYNRGASK